MTTRASWSPPCPTRIPAAGRSARPRVVELAGRLWSASWLAEADRWIRRQRVPVVCARNLALAGKGGDESPLSAWNGVRIPSVQHTPADSTQRAAKEHGRSTRRSLARRLGPGRRQRLDRAARHFPAAASTRYARIKALAGGAPALRSAPSTPEGARV